MADDATAPAPRSTPAPGSAPGASLREQIPEPVRSLARQLAAIVTAGVVGALTWLVVVQEGGKRGYTDLDVNHALGEVWRGPIITGRVREQEAFGVVGDPVAPTGLRVALASGVVLALLYGLVARLLPLRRWWHRGLLLGLATFLVTSLVYAPLVESRGVAQAGPFGLDAGAGTPVVFAAGALVFGIVAARVYELMANTRWWQAEARDSVAALAAVVAAAEGRKERDGRGPGVPGPPGATSLELAEEGGEQGRVGPGG